ncbi:MAG: hypothetical protein LKJ31_02020 [Atopobiaceae bacterium]|nr:hypothetical protein [Atopobiaceae bacterium]
MTASALELYQTKLRKLSLTIWVVDYSHSVLASVENAQSTCAFIRPLGWAATNLPLIILSPIRAT